MNEPVPINDLPTHDFDAIRGLMPGLVLFARQRCRNAEDVVQEAIMKLLRQPHPPENVTAWLFHVVRRDAMNSARSESRRSRHEQLSAELRTPWFDAAPDQTLDAEAASDALRSQPLELREVIVARLWGGLTFDEIGELTETSSRTASRRYQIGLESLRKTLGFTIDE